MTEHTRLPWITCEPGDVWVGIEGEFADYHSFMAIAKVVDHSQIGPPEARANAAYIVKACNAYPELMEVLEKINGWATNCGSPDYDKSDALERLAIIKSLSGEALFGKPPAPTCDDFVGGRTDSEST